VPALDELTEQPGPPDATVMAPPRGGRMGGCETHSADLRTTRRAPHTPVTAAHKPAGSSSPQSSAPACPRQARSSSPAPYRALPLRALQLDPRPRGGAKYRQLRGKPAEAAPASPATNSRVTGPAHHALLTKVPHGRAICAATVVRTCPSTSGKVLLGAVDHAVSARHGRHAPGRRPPWPRCRNAPRDLGT
jgi:hypothetical protein